MFYPVAFNICFLHRAGRFDKLSESVDKTFVKMSKQVKNLVRYSFYRNALYLERLSTMITITTGPWVTRNVGNIE